MNEPWTLTIPKGDLPWINSNDRKHWRVKARETKAWHYAVDRAIGRHGRPPTYTYRVLITATIHKTRLGRWDSGNLYPTVKAIVDALVVDGLLIDDSNEYVEGPNLRPGEKRAQACVVITIEPAA